MALVLASQSPRRRELMCLIVEDFLVDTADVDERAYPGEAPAQLAERLARAKALAVLEKRGSGDIIIGCDTVVELKGIILGKPQDESDAKRMLHALSGNVHLVHTGLCVLFPERGEAVHVETTSVTFSILPSEGIDAVAATAEPYDKAGGYGIQGWAARYIPAIEGCYYNVMGLPVSALWRLLQTRKCEHG